LLKPPFGRFFLLEGVFPSLFVGGQLEVIGLSLRSKRSNLPEKKEIATLLSAARNDILSLTIFPLSFIL